MRGQLPPETLASCGPGTRYDGELPPGLQREALPPDLERRLSKLPEGDVRIIVGTDIVLQDTLTRVVIDVIKNIAY